LTVLRQYKKSGEIISLVFCALTLSPTTITDVAPNKSGKLDIKSLSPSFFYGTDRGSILYADDVGHCTEVQQLSSPIDVMMFFEEKSRLIVINRSALLTQYHVSDDGKVTRLMQVKLSISPDLMDKGLKSVVWAGPGILAAATEEKVIRFVDLLVDESYNISLVSSLGGFVDRNDRSCCVAFNPSTRYLAVGTYLGIIAIWKFIGTFRDLSSMKTPSSIVASSSSSDWELIFRTSLGSQILQISWWRGSGSLAVVTEDGAAILNESIIRAEVCSDLFVTQESSHELSIFIPGLAEPKFIQTAIQIKGLSLGRSCFVVWNNKVAKIFRVDSQTLRVECIETLKSTGTSMAIADTSYIVDEAWFVAEASVVKINNFKGIQKGVVNFSEAEGNPAYLDVHGKYLAIVTTKGCIKVCDVHTPKQPKQLGTAGYFETTTRLQSTVKMIKVNSSGTLIAILCNIIEGTDQINYPDSKLFIFDRNKGCTIFYDFKSQKRYPISVFWDESDDRLLACETVFLRDASKGKMLKQKQSAESETKGSDTESFEGPEVFIMFASSDNGILMQDSMRTPPNIGPLMGLVAPKLYYRKPFNSGIRDEDQNYGNWFPVPSTHILYRIMRDFVGIDNVTEGVKSSLLDFSYFLTLGKLDDAYRVVREINSPAIWENMAQMCVKTKRLDVAEVCLGNMGHARGAAAVRESKKEGNIDVAIGVLAIQLGLIDDAATIFIDCNRFDLLNNLYQSSGRWRKAIQVAENKDRIHLKTTHYNYAKYLESIGNIPEAIEHFQLSNNARQEVPRMLFHLGRMEELSEFVMQTEDSTLLKWWASYLESIGRLDRAKKFYNKAKDYLSLVRIACFQVTKESLGVCLILIYHLGRFTTCGRNCFRNE
jgi:intraflagellar transport protein 140